ncbi:MAG: hypothetical protein ACYDER_04785 [Ktedonobacteraceae bacterium]
MGVERAVTRWYAIRQCLLDEIAAREAQLAQKQNQEQAQQHADVPPVAGMEISRQLAEARTKLRDLGPCPKVMMG